MATSSIPDPRLWPALARLEAALDPRAVIVAAEALVAAIERCHAPEGASLALFAADQMVVAHLELDEPAKALRVAEQAVVAAKTGGLDLGVAVDVPAGGAGTRHAADPGDVRRLALLRHHEAHAFLRLGRAAEALAALESLDQECREVADTDVRETVAVSALNRAVIAADIGDTPAAEAIWAEIVSRYGADADPEIRSVVSAALLLAAETLADAGEFGRARMAIDEAVRRGRVDPHRSSPDRDPVGHDSTGAESVPSPCEVAVRALVLRARMGRNGLADPGEVLSALREAIQLADAAVAPVATAAVAEALDARAETLGNLGRHDEAAEALIELRTRVANHPDPSVRSRSVRAIRGAADRARGRGDRAVAIAFLRSAIRDHAWDGGADVEAELEQVFAALAEDLEAAKEHRDALDAWDDCLELLGRRHPVTATADPRVRRARAAALFGRARGYRHLALPGWTLETLDGLRDQFAADGDPGVVAILAAAADYRAATAAALRTVLDGGGPISARPDADEPTPWPAASLPDADRPVAVLVVGPGPRSGKSTAGVILARLLSLRGTSTSAVPGRILEDERGWPAGTIAAARLTDPEAFRAALHEIGDRLGSTDRPAGVRAIELGFRVVDGIRRAAELDATIRAVRELGIDPMVVWIGGRSVGRADNTEAQALRLRCDVEVRNDGDIAAFEAEIASMIAWLRSAGDQTRVRASRGLDAGWEKRSSGPQRRGSGPSATTRAGRRARRWR